MKKNGLTRSHRTKNCLKYLIMVKITCLMFILTMIQARANNIYAQNTKMDIQLENADLEQVIWTMKKQSKFKFFYNSDDVKEIDGLNVNMKNATAEEILTHCLQGTSLDFEIKHKAVVLVKTPGKLNNINKADQVQPQTKTISGKVTDENGESLPGVSVVIKGTTVGTITDINGNYSLEVPENAKTLVFSFVGMKDQEFGLTGQESINLVMEEDFYDLDEVVAVGYGVQKKVNLTGAVEQINAVQIENNLGTNTSQVIQGLAPNLNVTFNDGGITEEANINIRGIGSTNGGEPLVLIDGVEGNMNKINPKDIKTISVLKDAASASIYGARAAFGVVLITTKEAKSGRIKVNYSANYGISSPTIRTDNFITDGLEWARLSDKLSLLENTDTYLDYKEEDYEYLEARKNDPSLPSVLIKTIDGKEHYMHYANTDWWDYLFSDTQPSTEQNISLSGGNEKANFYLSGRYYNRKGIYKINPDVLNSYTLRSKINVKPLDWMTIGNSTNIFTSKYKHPGTNTRSVSKSNNHEDWRKYTFHAAPLFNPRNPDGSIIIKGAYTPGRDIADGTFADLTYGKSKGQEKSYELTNTTSLNISLIKGLSLNTDYTFRKRNPSNWVRLISTPHTNQPDGAGVALYKENKQIYKEMEWNETYQAFNAYANYSYLLGEKHTLSGVVGFNQEWLNWKRIIASRNGNLSEELNSFNLATGENIFLDSDEYEWAIRAAFYRLNYNFSDKYLVEFNGRFDLSSKFPKDKRLEMFPSVSAAWKISEEDFFNTLKPHLNTLKLRASYGTLGNQDVGPYDYISIMDVNQSQYIRDGNKINYLTTPTTVSSNFSWETAATLDLGIDITAFNNRLAFTFDWYERNTTDMLMRGKKLPSVYGADEPDENAADLQTRGFELSIKWKNQTTIAKKPFEYSIGFVLADNVTKITKFDNPEGNIEDLDEFFYVGQEYGEIWGYTVEGFFQTDDEYLSHADQIRVNERIHNNYLINHPVAGDIKFKDVNGDGIISAGDMTLDDHGDLSIIGNSSPRFPYAITLGANYAGFDLNIFMQGIYKQNWWPGKDNPYFFGPFGRQYQNFYPKSIESNSWTPDNPDAYFPRLAVYSVQNQGLEGSQLGVPSDKYLQNAGYLRLKNITLGYTLPQKWTDVLKIESVRLYASGSNLLTFSELYKNNPDRTVDPEQLGNGNAYPFSKTYVFGIDVKF